jgi:triosephosphate isomerase
MERKGKFIVGNWKMHGDLTHLKAYAETLRSFKEEITCPLVVCPPFVYLFELAELFQNSPLLLGAQGCHPEVAGAYTGDVSAQMLADVGAKYVILGHSERRSHHGESDDFIKRAIGSAHHAGLIPIVCVGENLAEREGGHTLKVLEAQCQRALPPSTHCENTLIAYEPLWAVGTGHAATSVEIKEVHGFLRSFFASYPSSPRPMPLLYGGSVTSQNAEEILSIPEVDGVLVGKSSLAASSFLEIASVATFLYGRERDHSPQA